ncbi:7884_t:CDS:10, partial [Racocetra fulgida]
MPGGYFIINGSEKVLIAQERLASNCLFVFKTPSPSTHTHTAEIKSTNEKGDVALDYIGRRASPSGAGQERRVDLKRKSYYLGYMIHRLLLCAVGSRQLDDRDHLGKKRLDTAGTLLRNLFSSVYKKMIREMTEHLKKVRQACGLMKNFSLMSYISVGESSKLLIDHINETGTLQAFSQTDDILQDICTKTKVILNGNWVGVTRSPDDIVISLKEAKKAFCEDISIVNDVNDRELRIYCDPGRVCRPLFAVHDSSLVITHDHIRKLDLTRTEQLEDDHEDYLDWDRLIQEGCIEYLDAEEEEVSLICMTPEDLVEARNKWGYAFLDMQPPPMKKRSLFERMKTTPAFTDRWTHCEIHPSMILGICASLIPFPDHNQSPRNTYQSAMGKQAMGIHATNYQLRMDITSNILYYPQKPLVTTKVMEYLKFREMPAGQNAIVAILCYGGYNQEDSIIMNQSGIDRGLFRSFTFRNYQDSEKRMGVLSVETIERPDPQYTIGLKHGSYHKLGEDGVIIPGIAVSGGDILIGKVTPLPPDVAMLGQRSDTQINRDISTMLRYAEIGYVDQVLLGSNQENAKFVKVRIRSTRIPEIGDKFASRHGQKGTIGMVYRQEDMPFTREGIIPDIIINPHAIPSRMTIGHLIECLMGKLSVLTGNEGDATPFTDVTVEDLSKNLREQGYHSRGLEVMYNAEGRNREGGLRFGEMERD